ncbi:hypothetical protein N8T08_006303 [Aspergillus melleus]|uniref:Uncharacterized protein n=1 Tax=Aspergillus melleus TaxID=138277 RepID=A0ACC3B0D8_9EURO|nr:hypothetical protein N8T08_006303 [Aspergillus melleus]
MHPRVLKRPKDLCKELSRLGVHEESGKPNAIYFSDDTVYIDELKQIKDRVHVMAAVLNLGNATFEFPVGPIQITVDGWQAGRAAGGRH